MGDFVDRGKNSIETMCLLLAYKIRYPNQLFLIRGNHECEKITRTYGFYEECRKRYSILLWKEFISMFDYLPLCALIDERIFCTHGGLSPHLTKNNN